MAGRRWTPSEDRWLRKNFGKHTIPEIARILGRTPYAVETHAGGIGLKRPYRIWTPDMVDYLRDTCHRFPGPDLARGLNVSLAAVYSKAMVLGITKHQSKHVSPHLWTSTEDSIISSNYGEIRPSEIAWILGRTRASVYHRIDRLGLASGVGTPEYLRRQALPRTAHPFTESDDPAVLGYVAGIIDGEGAILQSPHLSLSVTTTTKELAVALQTMVGGSVAGPYRYGKTKMFGRRRCRVKPQYHWNFSAKYHVYMLLKALRPFLVVKAKAAQQAIAYFEERYRWGTQ